MHTPRPIVESGRLRRPDGAELYWETSGAATGVPLLHLHGGPGSGLGEHYRSFYDPDRVRVIGVDQRGCGRSTPWATDSATALASSTTTALLDDLEALREHVGVDAWIVSGVSWGSTLALAYAVREPERVRGLLLTAVTTTSAREVEWLTEGMARFVPAEWDAFAAAVDRRPGERLVDSYERALTFNDETVRRAAADAWCRWEDAHVSVGRPVVPSPRFSDPAFRLLFATLVVRYFAHSGFPVDGGISRNLARLTGIPITLIHGSADLSSPLETAHRLHEALPGSRLIVVPGTGHGGDALFEQLARASDALTADVSARRPAHGDARHEDDAPS